MLRSQGVGNKGVSREKAGQEPKGRARKGPGDNARHKGKEGGRSGPSCRAGLCNLTLSIPVSIYSLGSDGGARGAWERLSL